MSQNHRVPFSLSTVAAFAWEAYPPLAILIIALMVTGCGGDKAMTAKKQAAEPNAQLASANIQPLPAYPSELTIAGTAAARATIMHGKDEVLLFNLSRVEWGESRIWLNGRYSAVLSPTEPGQMRQLRFSYFHDAEGNPFPSDNTYFRVERVELQLGDELSSVRFGLDR